MGASRQNLPFFPIMLDVSGRKCVVVGAGKIAAGKIAGLLSYGAQIVVVAPRAVREIKARAQRGELTWHSREFSSKDVKGALLAIAATNSAEVNAAVFRACRRQRVFCNSVDDPEHCDFYYPAVVRRGPLQIAISTNGYSPALASRLRKQLEKQFGREWSAWVEHLGESRREILDQNLSMETRRSQLMKLASPQGLRAFTARRERSKIAR
jgi:siroheme synthase-like protein